MHKVVLPGVCVVVLAAGVDVASADVVGVAVTGHVSSVSDSSLGVTVGQSVAGIYYYDASTPVSATGVALPASPPASISVRLAGGPSYQTQSNWTFQISVSRTWLGQFQYYASPSSGSDTTALEVLYQDFSQQWVSPSSLPTTIPPLSSDVLGSIAVYPPSSSGFNVQIDSVAVAPTFTVSPASGSFVAQQNFDAVLLFSTQASVSSMQASVNGNSIALSYPGTCQLAPANNAQRTALICPSASSVLAGLGGGPVTVNWQVTLADGSTFQQSVIWNLVL
jgi:hypothetical protein